jgi:hypothetical protein
VRDVDHAIDFREHSVFEAEHLVIPPPAAQFALVAIFGGFAVIEVADHGDRKISAKLAADIERRAGADGALGQDRIGLLLARVPDERFTQRRAMPVPMPERGPALVHAVND